MTIRHYGGGRFCMCPWHNTYCRVYAQTSNTTWNTSALLWWSKPSGMAGGEGTSPIIWYMGISLGNAQDNKRSSRYTWEFLTHGLSHQPNHKSCLVGVNSPCLTLAQHTRKGPPHVWQTRKWHALHRGMVSSSPQTVAPYTLKGAAHYSRAFAIEMSLLITSEGLAITWFHSRLPSSFRIPLRGLHSLPLLVYVLPLWGCTGHIT